ncbi:MAG TPA: S24 family peptidase [Candidatus Saccharibacteria bacterium]|nr:S24 family peptidase [Candidatus Saccharibacteria bacterium]
MHTVQQKLLDLAESKDLSRIPLRKIAVLIGTPSMSPGVLQHHFAQLEKKKLLFIDRKVKTQQLGADLKDDRFFAIPIVGMASCGPANQFADEATEGYLHVSKSSLRAKGKLFAVRAAGDSMNDARVATPNGELASINDGDYAIVDIFYVSVEDNIGRYIVSIINGMANIKKLAKRAYDYALLSESLSMEKYPPIIIHEDDNYLINGRVIAVVKG